MDITIIVDINTINYNCSWNDLLDQQLIKCNHSFDILEAYRLTGSHGNRSNYSGEQLMKWNKAYLSRIHPKPFILDKVQALAIQHNIQNVRCVYFRGTDKKIEKARVNYSGYLKHIPSEGNLWIQSDELEFYTYMKEQYPDRAFWIDEFNSSEKK